MGHPRVGIFVQVRLGSTRLKRKALLPLGGTSVIEQAMESLRLVPAVSYALLTDAASAPELGGVASAHGFSLFIGPENDVLRRYAEAARFTGVSIIVRATGDSPLVSATLAREILIEHEASRADLSHYLGCPLGTGVEVIGREPLEEAERQATDPVEREHMSTFLYRHRERFRLHEPVVSPELGSLDANVSVDTPEDYERVRRIYDELYHGTPIEVGEIVRWLREHPEQVSLKRLTY